MKAGARARLLLLVLLSGCAKVSTTPPPEYVMPNTSKPYLETTGANVLPVHVGASAVCGQGKYVNEPCTTITVCVPGTGDCQTVSDVLVDTGSVGLRLFSSVVTLSLPPVQDSGGKTIAECAQFGTGNDWGSLASADVVLGGEPAVKVPIQLIDSTYATVPSECSTPDTDPRQAGFNGILGVGLFVEDCGQHCASDSRLHVFYSCDGTTCNSATLARDQQPQNPVAHLPSDNNGVIVAMPQIDTGGAATADGLLILGVGTSSNNSPSGVSTYATDPNGNFTTQLSGQSLPGSFIDSGTNGLYFPNVPGLPMCSSSGPAPDFYCPTSFQVVPATLNAATGSAQASVQAAIANAEALVNSSNLAFVDLGAAAGGGGFAWGLPFFYGRAVVVGIEGKTSSLGTGPYLAY